MSEAVKTDAYQTNLPSKYFIARYEEVTGDKYDDWWLPNGILEIGRAFGLPVADSVLQGCTPPLRMLHLTEDFNKVFFDIEKALLRHVSQPTYIEATEPGTLCLALSYKHLIYEDDLFPRRRMTCPQKRHLLDAITKAGEQKGAERVILWVDQVMGQRNPRSERDWIRNGILPYFAFDVLILRTEIDPRRCWLFLERIIAETYSNKTVVMEGFEIIEKTHKMGTVTPIQEVASRILTGILVDKATYDEEDKDQIRKWASTLLCQDKLDQKYEELVSGSTWTAGRYNLNNLTHLLLNHIIQDGVVSWRQLSKQNSTGRWNGLTELLGVPDGEVTTATHEEVREFCRNKQALYIFKVFSLVNDGPEGERAVAIGMFHKSTRPPRVVVCALDSQYNHRGTHVIASCAHDCDNLLDKAACSFNESFEAIGGIPFKMLENTFMSGNRPPGYLYPNRLDSDDLIQIRLFAGVFSKHHISNLSQWPWFSAVISARDIEIDQYLGIIQAGDVVWT